MYPAWVDWDPVHNHRGRRVSRSHYALSPCAPRVTIWQVADANWRAVDISIAWLSCIVVMPVALCPGQPSEGLRRPCGKPLTYHWFRADERWHPSRNRLPPVGAGARISPHIDGDVPLCPIPADAAALAC